MKYLSLFSGIGGFELGIQQAYEHISSTKNFSETTKWKKENQATGIEERQFEQLSEYSPTRLSCIGYSEIDKYATQIYQKHFPEHKNYGDIKTINEQDLPDFDLLVGGFPCQSFSIAGKRKGFEDTRGTLFFDIARILRTKKPRLLFLENVKGLLSHDNGNTFRTIIYTLTELGYDLQWQVLNSKNFGVPQNRERVFIIGHLRGTSRPEVFPITESNPKDIVRTIEVGKVKVRKYAVNIENLKKVLREHKNFTNKQIAEKLNQPQTLVEHWFRNDNSFAIPDEKIWFQLKELLNIKTDEFDKSITEFEIRDNKFDMANRVYQKEGIAPTLTTLTGGHQHTAVNDGYSIRRLTPIECERLQGFPDGWTEKGLSSIMEICVNTNNVIEKQLLVLGSVSCTTRDGKDTEVRICESEKKEFASIVVEEPLPVISVINTINPLSDTVMLFNQKEILSTEELIKLKDTCEKMEEKSISKLWKITLVENYSREKLSIILTSILEITKLLTSTSARIDENIIGVIIHLNSQEQNYLKEGSLSLKMASIESVSDTQRYKCLGNAVTVNVITAIMERLLK